MVEWNVCKCEDNFLMVYVWHRLDILFGFSQPATQPTNQSSNQPPKNQPSSSQMLVECNFFRLYFVGTNTGRFVRLQIETTKNEKTKRM